MTEPGDGDGDGLPDSWECRFWGSAATWRGRDDPDGDGADNLAEYIAGTDPRDASDAFTLAAVSSGRVVRIAFVARAPDGAGYEQKTRRYAVWTRGAMDARCPWGPVEGYESVPACGQIVTYCSDGSPSQTFFRVSARLVPRADDPSKADGYRGIWFTLGEVSAYGDKYSGGLGTFSAKHTPMAAYAPEARKTFFVYGGTATRPDGEHLLAMASFYDHRLDLVPRPTVVHDKGPMTDPHDNPTLCIDGSGRIWVFVSGRATIRPGYRYRSLAPYQVDAFEQVAEEEMAYPQPWWVRGQGFLVLFTRYTAGRELYWNTSSDGNAWSVHGKLASMGGHYQVSACRGTNVITAFDFHPDGVPDRRTNLYFLQTCDRGRTWRTAAGVPVETPVSDPDSSSLVRNYQTEGRLVYLKDINFDGAGRPVILFLTSSHHQPGPAGDPRIWTVAHWTGTAWEFSEVTSSTHNYDTGSIYTEQDDDWRIVGPTEPGPQHYGTGGEMAMWTSRDRGAIWRKDRDITRHSAFNHSHARRPLNADPGFYAFWADGNPDAPSMSRIYFTTRSGDPVRVLPFGMRFDYARPRPLY